MRFLEIPKEELKTKHKRKNKTRRRVDTEVILHYSDESHPLCVCHQLMTRDIETKNERKVSKTGPQWQKKSAADGKKALFSPASGNLLRHRHHLQHR